MVAATRRNRRTVNIWPGFVDALASLLMVFVFVLLIFVLAQYFLTNTLAGRTRALAQLQQNISQLADTLALERSKTSNLQQQVSDLSEQLRATLAERDRLLGRLKLAQQQTQEANQKVETLQTRLAEADKTIRADKETIKLRLSEIASIQEDIAALRQVRDRLESKVATLSAQLKESRRQGAILRDRSKALEAKLAEEQDKTSLAQKELDKKDIRLQELAARIALADQALAQQKDLTETANTQIAQLNQQISALREQLTEVSAALSASEATVKEQSVRIEDLGKRLNVALARRVKELSRYRSEFFGRLREVLGERSDIRIVGDRFLFQSELFFATGSADIGEPGKRKLAEVATTLKSVAEEIPKDINWILQIEGFTDLRPIHTEQFPSNWELSTARALSIVKFLIAQGIPPKRLAAAGFAQFHPLDEGHTEAAYRRNRRIEMKFTQP